MLCGVCNSLDFDHARHPPRKSAGAKHHKSYTDLVKAALGGCELCQLIVWENSRNFQSSGDNGTWSHDAQLYCQYSRAKSNLVFTSIAVQGKSAPALRVSFGVFAEIDSPAARLDEEFRFSSPREASGNSPRCVSLAKEWVNNCLQVHGRTCTHNPPEGSLLPSRVIDIGPSESPCIPHLILSHGQTGHWVALSHAWGEHQKYVTDTQKISDMMNGIDMLSLDVPQTFKDAITVTRRLGFRYLWIDSLCIIQDSDSDWLTEARTMHKYYKYSALTIVVDIAKGDHEGFLDAKREKDVFAPVKLPFNTSRVNDLCYVYLREDKELHGAELSDPLSHRGWTLQEWLLSPRVLHYTSKGLFWECVERRVYETVSVAYQRVDTLSHPGLDLRSPFLPKSGQPDVHNSKSWNRSNRYFHYWYRIIGEYQRREFSIPQDRFPAIAGLAREVYTQTGSQYKAGLWLDDMHRGLLWATYGLGSQQKPSDYIAPTWSWASQLGSRRDAYDHITPRLGWGTQSDNHQVEIIECKVLMKDGDVFGRISGGYIRVRGRMLRASSWEGTSPAHINMGWQEIRSHQGNLPLLPVTAPDQLVLNFDRIRRGSLHSPIDTGPELTFLQIQQWRFPTTTPISVSLFYALILMPNPDGTYRRVGIAEIPIVDGLSDKGWTWKEVTVV